jgi:hypothetical protein
LFLASPMLLQRAHGHIQALEYEGLAAAIGPDHEIDPTQLIQTKISQRAEVLPAAGFDQGSVQAPLPLA